MESKTYKCGYVKKINQKKIQYREKVKRNYGRNLKNILTFLHTVPVKKPVI